MKNASRKKLHLGRGDYVIPGYINVDWVSLPGVDIVHYLAKFPWPFRSGSVDEVIMVDVLEHLPSITATMDEIYRITIPGTRVVIRVPYYNSWDASYDPTHVHLFNENSFDFFDPSTDVGKKRGYYSRSRFSIRYIAYLIFPYRRAYTLCRGDADTRGTDMPSCYSHPIMRSTVLHKSLTHVAHKFGNVIRALHVELVRM